MTRNRFLMATILALAVMMLGVVVVSAQNPAPGPGSISGAVYCDANDNGAFDPGEGVTGVGLDLWNDPPCNGWPSTYNSWQESGVDGAYLFPGLAVDEGCYYLSVWAGDQDLGFCRLPTGQLWRSIQLTASEPISQDVDFGFVSLWTKLVNGQPWVPDMTVTAETSDTLEVVDIVYLALPGENSTGIRLDQEGTTLVEKWDPAELDLIDAEWDDFTTVISQSGVLTWTISLYPIPPEDPASAAEGYQMSQVPLMSATLTKTFHVEPCTWTSTTLQEDLYQLWLDATVDFNGNGLHEQRPVVVDKTPPDLSIDSTYDSEVSPGDEASFTLNYGNAGGYENDVMIRNEFPPEGLFVSANPAPDREATDDTWAEWDVGDLATGAGGSIVVNVAIAAGLPPSTTIPITDHIYNHVEEIADTVVTVFHIEQPPLSLGDLVWYDTNQDGIQDSGEPGVKGILATLYMMPDCTGDPLGTDETDSNGIYGFSDLSPGRYCIQFDNIPSGWQITLQGQGSDDAVDSDADPTTARIENIQLLVTDLDEDMGLYVLGSKSGMVFCDADKNSQYDVGEEVSGVTVSLYDDPGCDGVPINLMETQDTAADGTYLFSDLDVGPRAEPLCYYASVDEEDMGTCNVPITPVGYAVALDADNPDEVDNDFGFQQPSLSLGDLVWYDTNQDGIQDAGEPGVKGISATLHMTPDCSGNAPLGTTETDSDGIYGFSDLEPGRYCIQFDNIPSGWQITLQGQGSDDAVDSDADPTTARIENIQLLVTDLDEDMGLYVLGSKSGMVFCDADKNSQSDVGEEVSGVTVSLYDDPGCDGVPINLMDTQDTAADGTYLFSDLDVGPRGEPLCYYASVDEEDMGTCNVPITPVGYAVALEADSPDEIDNDFGFQVPPPEPSSLGDWVWHDADQDGIQDAGEAGIGGVSVTLYDCDGSTLRTTTTDPSGIYGFTGLDVGSYRIGFSVPQGWQFTLQNQGTDDSADSDADPSTGQTVCIALGAGVDDPAWDAGMYLIPVIEPEPPPVVPEASTLLLLGSALTGLAGYAGLQLRARRRK